MLTEEALKYLRSLEGYTTVVQPVPEGRFPSEVIAVPEKSRLESLERFQAVPNRIKHVAHLHSSAALIDYVNRFKGKATSVYLDIFDDAPIFVAVLDHHEVNAPAWNEHRAAFAPRVSLEWQAWTALHKGGPLRQADLLAFFEDHARDLFEPAPTVMLGHLQKFEQVEKHTYSSATNLDNGNIEVVYIKDGGQRKVAFPHTLQVHIPVLENEDPIVLEGRLRYRTSEGSIAFQFQFKQDPERIKRDELRRLAGAVKAETGVRCYEGRVAR